MRPHVTFYVMPARNVQVITDTAFAEKVVTLTFCNPFTPDRVRLEREILGRAYVRRDPILSRRDEIENLHPNVEKIRDRVRLLLDDCLSQRASLSAKVMKDLLSFYLYH